MRDVVDDFLVKYGVDGIKIDGLADPEGQLTDVLARQHASDVAPYLPATDILRLIAEQMETRRPGAYLESGWINPVFAHPYAHTFWWGDNWPDFAREYPFGGLAEHIEYAVFQQVALGQRAKLATVWGEPNGKGVRSWFAAGLALGAQVTAGFDLTAMSPQSLSELRCLLAHYNAFDAEVVPSARMRPSAFATTTNHLTYLGVLNRGSQPRAFAEEIGELNVIAPGLMAFDVETKAWQSATSIADQQIPARSFRLFIIAHQPGIVWSNASWSYDRSDDSRLVATVQGPASLSGFADIWAPDAMGVTLDGVALRRAATAGPDRYRFDPRTGVVHLQFGLGGPHQVEVHW
jgi:hypothetical protein